MKKFLLLFLTFCCVTQPCMARDAFGESVAKIQALIARFNAGERPPEGDMAEMAVMAKQLRAASREKCFEEIKPILSRLLAGVERARQAVANQQAEDSRYFEALQADYSSSSLGALHEVRVRAEYISRAYLVLGTITLEISRTVLDSVACKP